MGLLVYGHAEASLEFFLDLFDLGMELRVPLFPPFQNPVGRLALFGKNRQSDNQEKDAL